MRKSKILTTTLAIIMMIVLFSGCFSETKSDFNLVDVDQLISDPTQNFPPIVFGGNNSVGASSPSSITENPTDDTSVSSDLPNQSNSSDSANVEIPLSNNYYTATAETFQYVPEEVKRAILGDADTSFEILESPNREPTYVWKNAEKELFVDNDANIVDFSTDFCQIIDQVFPNPVNYSRYLDYYELLNVELDFCSSNEAIKSVAETLSRFGVNVSAYADIYALHQEELQRVADEECKNGRLLKLDENGIEVPISTCVFDKSQECYYIVLYADYKSVPIYNRTLDFLTIKDLSIFHPTITAVYSANGLEKLFISEYRTITNESEEITQIISPETVTVVVGEKYKDVVGIEMISFDRISLMYVYTANTDNGKINLRSTRMSPAWICTISITQNTFDSEFGEQVVITTQKDIVIDAQTGMEII